MYIGKNLWAVWGCPEANDEQFTCPCSFIHLRKTMGDTLVFLLGCQAYTVTMQCNIQRSKHLTPSCLRNKFHPKSLRFLTQPRFGLREALIWHDKERFLQCSLDIHSVSSRHLGPNVGGKLQSTRKVDLRLGRPDLGGRPGWHPNLKNFLIKKGAVANVLNTSRFLIWDSAHSAWTRCFGRFSKGIASNKQVSALGETTSHAVHDRTAAQIKQEMVIAMACTCRLPGGKLEPWN